MLIAVGEASVLVAETVGEASLNFLLKRWLGQTAEAVLVHGSIAEDEEYLNPQNYYTNASNLLGCLRTAWKHQY